MMFPYCSPEKPLPKRIPHDLSQQVMQFVVTQTSILSTEEESNLSARIIPYQVPIETACRQVRK
jgi:hypothetical protein